MSLSSKVRRLPPDLTSLARARALDAQNGPFD
jgi:hypothetical protein